MRFGSEMLQGKDKNTRPSKGSPQQQQNFFLGDLSQICLSTHTPTPGFLGVLGERKVKFGSKRAIFGVIWGGFEGFGPCLGVSHPTHPHLGEISQKKRFFLAASLKHLNLWSGLKSHPNSTLEGELFQEYLFSFFPKLKL